MRSSKWLGNRAALYVPFLALFDPVLSAMARSALPFGFVSVSV